MKKKVIIVHCWGGTPESGWYPCVKEMLEERGFEVAVPSFPDTDFPDKNKWVAKIAEVASEPSIETFFIGHSIGTTAILRYLESLEEKGKISGAVFVAPYVDNLGFKELESFFSAPFDFEKIKKLDLHFRGIYSDNDPYVPLSHADILRDQLGVKPVIMHNAGHFENEDGVFCVELVNSLEAVVTADRKYHNS